MSEYIILYSNQINPFTLEMEKFFSSFFPQTQRKICAQLFGLLLCKKREKIALKKIPKVLLIESSPGPTRPSFASKAQFVRMTKFECFFFFIVSWNSHFRMVKQIEKFVRWMRDCKSFLSVLRIVAKETFVWCEEGKWENWTIYLLNLNFVSQRKSNFRLHLGADHRRHLMTWKGLSDAFYKQLFGRLVFFLLHTFLLFLLCQLSFITDAFILTNPPNFQS